MSTAQIDNNEDQTRLDDTNTSAPLRSPGIDSRLQNGPLPGLTVQLCRHDDEDCFAVVRAFSDKDLVLGLPNRMLPQAGEVVAFTLFDGETRLVTDLSAVVHWTTTPADDDGAGMAALFCSAPLSEKLNHRLPDDRRGEIRFPLNLQVEIGSGQEHINATIIDYSLNGIALQCRETLELNCRHVATIGEGDDAVKLGFEPQWVTEGANGNVIGCALDPNYGVMLSGHGDPLTGVRTQLLTTQLLTEKLATEVGTLPEPPNEPSLTARTQANIECSDVWLDRGSLLRSVSLPLATFLIGLSVNTSLLVSTTCLLAGATGLIVLAFSRRLT